MRDLVQVVPDVPTFAVDRGFAYGVPDGSAPAQLGSIVRIPLSGRRTRGYVVGVPETEPPRLKDIASVSTSLPIFDTRLLETIRWAADHYVAPLATLLSKASPPNLARPRGPHRLDELPPPIPLDPLLTKPAGTAGRSGSPHYLVGSGPWARAIGAISHGVLASGRSVVVIAPTVVEARRLADDLSDFGNRVVFATSALTDAEVTKAWVQARTTPGCIVVGTREVSFWPIAKLALAVVVEEGRRAMKAPQSPRYHVRDVVIQRSRREQFGVVFCGPVPTAEALSYGSRTVDSGGRAWALVELADWSTEPPGRGVLMDYTRQAIVGVSKRGGRVFVFVPRRGYAPAFRCVKCLELRRCPTCGSGPDRAPNCLRCGALLGPCAHCGGSRFQPLGAGVGRVIDDLARSVGDRVGGVDEHKAIMVGNERDLPGLNPVDLAVSVDSDGLLLAPTYRAEEDGLRVLARVAGAVKRGSGRRAVMQTSIPGHRVMVALQAGDGVEVMKAVVSERRAAGFPPAAEVMSVELTNSPDDADQALREAAGSEVMVHGPAPVPDGSRWLVQGGDLDAVKRELRTLVQRWRDGGSTVRIDADPIEL